MTDKIKNESTKILDAIEKSNNILLHCHPFPDPDSVGSVLSMAKFLQSKNKKTTIISGDTPLPNYVKNWPEVDIIQKKPFSNINIADFDLFVILDSSAVTQISQLSEVNLPNELNTIVIDHHVTNQGFAKINLVESSYASTSQIIYDLFQLWDFKIDGNVALYLFMGIFADTGGFKYLNSTPNVFQVAAELTKINPSYHKFIFSLENAKKPIEIEMMGLALSSIEKYFSDKVVLSLIPYQEIEKRKLNRSEAMEGLVASTLRAVEGWNLVASLVEAEKGITTVSIRTRDEEKFDVSKVARSVGINGNGHRGAAGTTIIKPLSEAKEDLLIAFKNVFVDLS